jgi:hypothetical protein
MAEPINMLDKFQKLSPVGSLLLAAALAFTALIQRSAVNQQTVQSTVSEVQNLKQQVKALQDQVAQQDIIANELKNVKDQGSQTQQSVNRLADELHAWQREERALHAH